MSILILFLKKTIWRMQVRILSNKYGHIESSSFVSSKAKIYNTRNLYMYEKTNINYGSIIMNHRANFIMKKWSGAAFGLTVITGNHLSVPGKHHKMIHDKEKNQLDVNGEYDADVVVNEDVWIAANVTLLAGTHIGRCAIVGAGSVVRGNVPPYSIVAGNPAKIVGFRFTPKEAFIHEQSLFSEDNRMSFEQLQQNYDRFFLKKIKDIKNFYKL